MSYPAFIIKNPGHLRIKKNHIKRDHQLSNIDPSSSCPFSFSLYINIFIEKMTISSRQYTQDRLDYYYKVINKTIIAKQNASSGLMPASTAITVIIQNVPPN